MSIAPAPSRRASARFRRAPKALDALEVVRPEMRERERKQVVGGGRIERDSLTEEVERLAWVSASVSAP